MLNQNERLDVLKTDIVLNLDESEKDQVNQQMKPETVKWSACNCLLKAGE